MRGRRAGDQGATMSQNWDYQIRVNFSDENAAIARKNPADEALSPLGEILARHHAQLKNQFDAFAEYVSEAEHHGVEPLAGK